MKSMKSQLLNAVFEIFMGQFFTILSFQTYTYQKIIYIWFDTDNFIFQMCLVDQIRKYGDSSFKRCTLLLSILIFQFFSFFFWFPINLKDGGD